MNNATDSGNEWTVLRVLGLIFGLLIMGGFGFCSLCGLANGIGSEPMFLLVFILPGFLLAFFGFLIVQRMITNAEGGSATNRDDKPWRH